jgi:hypothetical protein
MDDWFVCTNIEGFSAADGNGCEVFFDSKNEAAFVAGYLNKHKINGKFCVDLDEHLEKASRLYKEETIISVVDLLDADNSVLHTDKGLHPKRRLRKKT